MLIYDCSSKKGSQMQTSLINPSACVLLNVIQPEEVIDASWCRAKVMSSRFLVYCRKYARGGSWTQEQLARALGVSKDYIEHVEMLPTNISAPLSLLVRAAEVTGVPFELKEKW